MEYLETLEQAFCKELETMASKMKAGTEMSVNDLEKADKLLHALKDLGTVKAMKEAEVYSEEGGMSGYRGRAANGRYVSRDSGNSYAEGYSRGYAEGRNQVESQMRGYPPSRPWNY